MYNVLLVGAGQLGSRHLQALALTQVNEFDITVIDPSESSLAMAESRLKQISPSDSLREVRFVTDYKALNTPVNFCVVATNADVRLMVLNNLLSSVHVEHLLLEKVLFQSESQLYEAQSILDARRVKTWVNCPRRMYGIYSLLRDRLHGEAYIKLLVHGNNWGLACNAIHFIDLWSYLTGVRKYEVDLSEVSHRIVDSKRPGYKEISGSLHGAWQHNAFSLISDCQEGPTTLTLSIETPKFNIEINESKGECVIKDKVSGAEEFHTFSVPFQSQLTNRVAESALLDGDVSLTPFNESVDLHAPFLRELLVCFRKYGGSEINHCPIT